MAGRRQAFRSNPELQQFLLPNVHSTGKQLGVGSYGSVEELEVNGLVCAGKRLHEALLQHGNAGVEEIVRRYLQECQLLAKMRHPHIVLFMGLCYLEGSTTPVLVMERMDSSLDELLESAPGLPLALKRSLLADVARGLLYLHANNPPIVHRDLSARNILLTSSLVAKISDLGNARTVNLQPGQLGRTLTRLPGSMVYMPPEAFVDHSRYGPRLDIFSFGHLTLFTLTQVFPGSLLPHTYPDPQNPGRLLARSEVERRWDYIQPLHQQLGEQHPLVQLVHQCLHNTPARRLTAEEVLHQLEAVRPQVERVAYGQTVNVTLMEQLRVLRAKDMEISHLQQQIQQLRVNLEAKDTQLEERDAQITRLHTELRTLGEDRRRVQAEAEARLRQVQEQDAQINRLQRELQTLTEDRGRLQEEVLRKEDIDIGRLQQQIQRLEVEMDAKDTQLQQQGTELEERDTQISRQQRELQMLREDRRRVQAEAEARLRQAQEKDAQINRLQRELQTLREDRGRLQEEVLREEDIDIGHLQHHIQQLEAKLGSQVEQQFRERDAEINRLWRELRDQTTSQEEGIAPPYKFQHSQRQTSSSAMFQKSRGKIGSSMPGIASKLSHSTNSSALQRQESLPPTVSSRLDVSAKHMTASPFQSPSSGAQQRTEYIAILYQPEYAHDVRRPWKAMFIVCPKNTPYATHLRKYRNSDFDEELHPSTPVGFCFLGDAVELDIPFHEAEHQGYTIDVDVTPCKIRRSDVDLPHPDFEATADDTYPPRIVLDIETHTDMPRRRLTCRLELRGTEGPVHHSFSLKGPRLRALPSTDARGARGTDMPDTGHEGILNSKPELIDLMEKVAAPIPAKWEEVGYALRIGREHMERIKSETIRLSSTMTSYREMFNHWLSHVLERCTWTTVLTALETRQVGEAQLARRIRQDLLKRGCNQ